MNKGEAMRFFHEFIKKPCELCGAKAGDLCDTPAVWVHFVRLIEVWKEKGQKQGADSGEAEQLDTSAKR